EIEKLGAMPPVYGISVNEDYPEDVTTEQKEQAVTYTKASVGLTPAKISALNSWENIYPYSKMRVVGFKDGEVYKEIKKENFKQYVDGTTVGTDVDVMIEIPKVYWKFETTEKGYNVSMASYKAGEGFECLAHTVGKTEKDFIYIGAYIGTYQNNKPRSITGVAPGTSSRETLRESIKGTGYQLFNYYSFLLLQILYLFAYKHLDSQIAFGSGSASQSYSGGTDLKGFNYGANGQQIKFLGVESLWGEGVNIFLDGICLLKNNNISLSNNSIFNNTGEGYEEIVMNSFTSGWIRKVQGGNKSGFLPKQAGRGSACLYSDYGRCSDKMKLVTTSGGNMPDGIFSLSSSDYYTEIATIWFRLVFLGTDNGKVKG
ncbi:hypothetical protein KWW24_18025, partial [Clostridioides difficile]|nr:hypothetical protein [Clostridioides difficile]